MMCLDVDDTSFLLQALCYLILWYALSFGTLFLNKYALSWLGSEPSQLGSVQIFVTTVCGGLQLCSSKVANKLLGDINHKPGVTLGPQERSNKSKTDQWIVFCRDMVIVGTMRFVTVILGLISLKHVAVSFTETVKASAPLFTVVIAWMMIGEQTGLVVILSLVPIMGGLALCSANEISFTAVGFMSALINNIVDWYVCVCMCVDKSTNTVCCVLLQHSKCILKEAAWQIL